jgi:hypothetical protein
VTGLTLVLHLAMRCVGLARDNAALGFGASNHANARGGICPQIT